ncbi:MAG: ferritin family protein [bacterium]
MEERLRRLIEQAIQMEKDGINFYENLSVKVPYDSSRRMILSFADDERRHLKILNDLFSSITSIDVERYLSEDKPKEKVKTIFNGMEEKVNPVTISDELSALKMAMDMEERSYKLYEEARDMETDSNLRRLWDKLVEEEKRHYNVFFNTYDFLSNPEDWTIREERGLLDGG